MHGCSHPARSKGLCVRHYNQAYYKPRLTDGRVSCKLSVAENLARLSRRDEKTGCLVWTGATSRWGYGRYGKKRLPAHRLSYEQAIGPIPQGMIVCHRCDNPPCIEPTHLFLGTHKTNAEDKVAKGRHLFGERAPSNKLTEGDVRAIRQDARSYAEIAEAYGMSDWTIKDIQNRRIWRHIP